MNKREIYEELLERAKELVEIPLNKHTLPKIKQWLSDYKALKEDK